MCIGKRQEKERKKERKKVRKKERKKERERESEWELIGRKLSKPSAQTKSESFRGFCFMSKLHLSKITLKKTATMITDFIIINSIPIEHD